MQPCRLVALLASALLLACSDATSPPRPATTQKLYALVSVDGQAVPTVIDSGAVGWLNVLGGSLALQTGDSAKEMFHQLDVSVQFGTQDESMIRPGSYVISADSIEVGFFGPCRDICVPNRIGRYEDTLITLAYDIRPHGAVYLYRLVPDSLR
jgi:hypothetical protein